MATRPPIRPACWACATTSNKNGFPGVILGLSGGIDSALVAAIAVDALGPAARARRDDAVPLHRRARASRDADACAKALGIRYQTLPIEEAVAGLSKPRSRRRFAGTPARYHRGEHPERAPAASILMALSNKFGAMVLTTGNKSEMSVGYATLYGDMNGGYNPIKDLYKMEVYRLARWRNAHVPRGGMGRPARCIPESIITKVPTAELRPNQTDQDSLPPYEALDDILVSPGREGDAARRDRRARAHAAETVKKIERLLYLAEYKRRQAPPGVKISSRNFGRDRRYPIVNKFREPL